MLRYNICAVFCLMLSFSYSQGVSIGGQFQTANAEAVGLVVVELLDAEGELIASQEIACDGNFIFTDLLPGQDYALRPHIEGSAPNGVTAYDMVLVMKHLLGLQELSVYPLLASDVDDSGALSVRDLVMMRALVLAIIENFPNSNYLFFREDDTQSATVFPFILSADLMDFNFIVAKKGDVNDSADYCH